MKHYILSMIRHHEPHWTTINQRVSQVTIEKPFFHFWLNHKLGPTKTRSQLVQVAFACPSSSFDTTTYGIGSQMARAQTWDTNIDQKSWLCLGFNGIYWWFNGFNGGLMGFNGDFMGFIKLTQAFQPPPVPFTASRVPRWWTQRDWLPRWSCPDEWEYPLVN